MSIESMAIVLHHSRAAGSEKLVLLGIANHDGDGGAWPSIATLARYANVEPRAVKKLITKLVERGEITKAMQAGGTRAMPDYTRPNLYHVKVVCPPECDRSAQHRIDRSNPVSHRTPGVPQDTPPVSHRTPPRCPTGHPNHHLTILPTLTNPVLVVPHLGPVPNVGHAATSTPPRPATAKPVRAADSIPRSSAAPTTPVA